MARTDSLSQARSTQPEGGSTFISKTPNGLSPKRPAPRKSFSLRCERLIASLFLKGRESMGTSIGFQKQEKGEGTKDKNFVPPTTIWTVLAAVAPWGSVISCKLFHIIPQINNRCRSSASHLPLTNAGVPPTVSGCCSSSLDASSALYNT